MPRSTRARCAPPVLPAKSMLRRSLATSFEAPNPYDSSFTAPGAGAAALEIPPTAASAAIDVVFAEFAPTGDDVLYFSAVVCGR